MSIVIKEISIPPEVFEEFLYRLSVDDVNNAAGVCRAWRHAANELLLNGRIIATISDANRICFIFCVFLVIRLIPLE